MSRYTSAAVREHDQAAGHREFAFAMAHEMHDIWNASASAEISSRVSSLSAIL